MTTFNWKDHKKLLFFPAAALGVLILVLLVMTRREPERVVVEEHARAVRVVPAVSTGVVPRAMGYGFALPGKVWEAVAEVSGRVVEMHPDLKKGAVIPKGAVLVLLDPQEYGLAENRDRADVSGLRAKLKELNQKKRNLERSLEVERRSLALSKNELERKRKLVESDTIASAEFDQEEKRFLSQQNIVQNLRNSLDLIPSERQSLLANLTAGQSRLDDTRLDLKKTIIIAPFDCRIAEVNVELDQFAKSGQSLIKADSISSAEVLAQFFPGDIKRLLGGTKNSPHPTAGMAAGVDMERFRELLGLDAVVRYRFPESVVEWQARFSRMSESIDPQTRTIGVYATVEDTYAQARPGTRPPLMKNMYCEVELQGRAIAGRLVIPRSAVRQGIVYVADADNRLQRRPVIVKFVQGGLAVIAEGLTPDENIVVTDVVPAVEGMLLDPLLDEPLLAALLAEAKGESEETMAQ
jgi:membrane fusion protein, multidrug efflux system